MFEWLIDHWYVILLICFVVFAIVFIIKVLFEPSDEKYIANIRGIDNDGIKKLSDTQLLMLSMARLYEGARR